MRTRNPVVPLSILLFACSPSSQTHTDAATAGITRTAQDVAPTAPLTFEIEAGAVGVHLAATSDIAGDVVVIESLVGPEGTAWVSAGMPLGSLMTTDQGVQLATVTLPMTSAMQAQSLAAGTYTATLSSFSGAPTLHTVVAVQHTPDGAFHGGVLDLDLFIPDGLVIQNPGRSHMIDATVAAQDAAVAARVDAFYASALTLAGLDRGEVRFHAIDASLAKIVSQPEIDAVHEQTQLIDTDRPSARVIWSNQLYDGATVWGQSGGIPGAGAMRGVIGSAVLLQVSPGASPVGDGMTMLHELGHFAGLFHTSDGGGGGDPIDDTPECADPSPDNYAACEDSHNLMFPLYWGASGGKNVVLSDGQRRVFEASPLYRATSRP